jgi:hypothetical protein
MVLVLLFASCEDSASTCSDLTDFAISSDHIDFEKKAPCELTTGRCGERHTAAATVKYRGNSSARFPKHSYTVELEDKKAFGKLSKSKHWVLNASYIDKSFMRHKLSFDLFRQMDPDNKAPRCEYVTVHENNADQGLYVLMERMDKQRLQLKKKDAMAFISKEPPLFYTPDPAENRDSLYRASMEFPKQRDRKNPDTGLQHLEWLIFQADDATFKREIFRVIDFDNFIDWQLIILFTNNDDGQLKNYYIYRPNDNARMRIALWDYDHTFGRTGNSGKPNMLVRRVDEKRNPLYRRLIELNPNGFNEQLAKRWKQLRKSVFTEKNIDRMIAENDRIIAPYSARNAKIWPVDGAFYYDKSTYQDELKRIRTFVGKRLKQLDERFG